MAQNQFFAALAVCMLLAAPVAADPCAAPPAEVHLTTRKPVKGADARFEAEFGMRLHPLLNEQRMHTGIDWSTPMGTRVIAAAAGRVSKAEHMGQYGTIIIIDHGGGVETVYAHLSALGVKAGDCVADGATIGTAGSTGLTSFTGVHFEVRHGGAAVDPLKEPITGKD